MNDHFTSDELLAYLEDSVTVHMDLAGQSEAGARQKLSELKEQIYRLLKIDELRSLLCTAPETEKLACFASGETEVVKYAVRGIRELDMPLYVVGQSNPASRSVLYLQGHHPAGALGCVSRQDGEAPFHKYLPILLAERGFRVYVPELLGFGEARRRHYDRAGRDDSECLANEIVLVSCGFSLAGLRTVQCMLTLDVMRAMGVEKAGLFGLSGGGMSAMYLGALDERITSMVINGYAGTTKGTLFSRHHCIDNYISGMLRVGKCSDILAAFAPRPQLILNGDQDRVFPAEGALEACSEAREMYRMLRAEDKLQAHIFPGVHETPAEIVIKWFEDTVEG